MPRSIKTAVPNREGKEEAVSPQKKEATPASLRGHSLLPMEGGAPKGRRLDGESGIFVSQPSPRETGRGIHFSFTNFHLSMI